MQRLLGTLALTALGTISPAALASVDPGSTVSGAIEYHQGAGTGTLTDTFSNPLGEAVSISGTRAGLGFDALAATNGTRLSALAATYGTPGMGNVSSQAMLGLTDFITFLGGSGTGSASFSAMLQGTLTGTAQGTAGYLLDIALYETTATGALENPQLLAMDTRQIGGPQQITVLENYASGFSFEYGKTYGLVASFTAKAQDGGIADFTSGMSFALGATPGVSLASAAGIHYGITAAVPEPASAAMLLAGLGLVGLIAYRRR